VLVNDLLKNLPVKIVKGNGDIEVTDIADDSRNVSEGALFIASKGERFDSHKFIKDLSQAACVLLEDWPIELGSFRGAVYQTKNTSLLKPELASRFFSTKEARQALTVWAVTGTNGKTSLTHYLESALNNMGRSCGVIGTVGHRLKAHSWPTELTTPGVIDFHRRIFQMKKLGATDLAFEASSHALVQKRIEGVFVNTAVFTNLTLDHLDYHKTMQTYFEAKERLISQYLVQGGVVILNSDDEWVRKVKCDNSQKVYWVGSTNNERLTGQKIQIEDMRCRIGETTFSLESPWGSHQIKTTLTGAFNAWNAAAVFAGLCANGFSAKEVASVLGSLSSVKGRMETVELPNGAHAIIDFAHSPDALEKVLNSLSQLKRSSSKLVALFGCGGDRDRSKRPIMAKIAERFADEVWITSDNPRTEDPDAIIKEIASGLPKTDKPIFNEVDRAKAISKALHRLSEGDTLLIAGKGHEEYQIIGSQRLNFSDRKEVDKFLAQTSS